MLQADEGQLGRQMIRGEDFGAVGSTLTHAGLVVVIEHTRVDLDIPQKLELCLPPSRRRSSTGCLSLRSGLLEGDGVFLAAAKMWTLSRRSAGWQSIRPGHHAECRCDVR